MHSSNLRSLVRTLLRAEAQKYSAKTGLNIPEITEAVVKQLKERVLSEDEREDCLYALIYSEAKELFKTGGRVMEPLQLEFLVKCNVPRPHAELLVRIDEEGLQVPCQDGKNRIKPLWGKERMSRAELKLAAALVRRKGEETIAKADLLDQLSKLPGYYK
jgi:hypothetical protein